MFKVEYTTELFSMEALDRHHSIYSRSPNNKIFIRTLFAFISCYIFVTGKQILLIELMESLLIMRDQLSLCNKAFVRILFCF